MPSASALRRSAQGWRARGSVFGEADEAGVEDRIPKCRENQAVVHIETLRVVAIGPRHDVGGTQQGGIGDAGDRAAAAPVIDQRGAENVLADALNDEPLGLGRLRQACGLRAKPGERGVGKADAELIHAVERGMEYGQAAEFEGRLAGSDQGRRRQGRKLRRDTRMIDREEPGASGRSAGNPDFTMRGGRRIA